MDQVIRFLSKYYLGLGTPHAKVLKKHLDVGEWVALQQGYTIKPSDYQDAESYRLDNLANDVARKLLLPGDRDVRLKNAVDTFYACEKQNASTNARLNRFIGNQGPFGDPSDERVSQFITAWRKELKRALGKAPFILDYHFSGGSTLSDKGKLTTIPDKMSSVPTVYARSKFITEPLLRFTPLHRPLGPVSVRGNRFFTVPKDSFKDRGCCVEASVNVGFQLSVGARLKTRYRQHYKVDLLHAQPLHRDLAQLASRTGCYATIDLSNASDTVARKLVELLLPPDWYELLNSLRSPTTEILGTTVWLEKFSSMGNGFTFELETFLFRSLCEVITGGETSSYCFGDDIIIASRHSKAMMAALRYFGFTPNDKKTFCDGPFRESCGGDFYDGQPVRAYYLKKLPDEPTAWIAIANGVRRADPSLKRLGAAWRYAVDQIPKRFKVFGPERLGDSVICDPTAQPTLKRFSHKCSGGEVTYVIHPAWQIVRPIPYKVKVSKHFTEQVIMASYAMGLGDYVTPRESVTGYKVAWLSDIGVSDPGTVIGLI